MTKHKLQKPKAPFFQQYGVALYAFLSVLFLVWSLVVATDRIGFTFLTLIGLSALFAGFGQQAAMVRSRQ